MHPPDANATAHEGAHQNLDVALRLCNRKAYYVTASYGLRAGFMQRPSNSELQGVGSLIRSILCYAVW